MKTAQERRYKIRAIWHIYHGTRGAAGAYIDALQSASYNANIKSYAFVSSRYAFKTRGVIKYFFPITDSTEKRNKLIKALRGLELVMGYLFIWLAALVARPVINLHMAGYFGAATTFFRVCKLVHLRVYATCHDVAQSNLSMDRRRRYILEKAQKLVVHSSAAFNQLIDYLGEQIKEKIVRYPFPFSCYDSILTREGLEAAETSLKSLLGEDKENYFLFIGVIRQSKGIDTLLDAWHKTRGHHKCKLLIGGKWAGVSKSVKRQAEQLENCIVLDRYLTNEEFVVFIKHARFTVLPYLEYSHSSVLISCAKHGGAVIVSDIDLFEDYLNDYDLTFPKGDSKNLAVLLDRAARMSEDEVRIRAESLKNSVERHDDRLVRELIQAYKC